MTNDAHATWPFENEEAVVVYKLAATVQVQERGHVFAGFIVDELFIFT
jgi:hypothetical protein